MMNSEILKEWIVMEFIEVGCSGFVCAICNDCGKCTEKKCVKDDFLCGCCIHLSDDDGVCDLEVDLYGM